MHWFIFAFSIPNILKSDMEFQSKYGKNKRYYYITLIVLKKKIFNPTHVEKNNVFIKKRKTRIFSTKK